MEFFPVKNYFAFTNYDFILLKGYFPGGRRRERAFRRGRRSWRSLDLIDFIEKGGLIERELYHNLYYLLIQTESFYRFLPKNILTSSVIFTSLIKGAVSIIFRGKENIGEYFSG